MSGLGAVPGIIQESVKGGLRQLHYTRQAAAASLGRKPVLPAALSSSAWHS